MDDYLSPLISINPHCPLIALVLLAKVESMIFLSIIFSEDGTYTASPHAFCLAFIRPYLSGPLPEQADPPLLNMKYSRIL